MNNFESTMRELLQSELEASEEMVSRIAKKAYQFRQDTEAEFSPENIIERMEKRHHDSAKAKWNNVVGFLDAKTWSIEENGKDSEYKLG